MGTLSIPFSILNGDLIMKKSYKLEQLEELKIKYPKVVLHRIEEVIIVINENYGGEFRNTDEDLSGDVILIDK